MTQEATTTTSPADAPAAVGAAPAEAAVERRCPWCSEVLPASETVRCPHCYANLVPDGEPRVPGLTEVEGPAATKVRRAEAPKRSKLLSWISGDVGDEPSIAEATQAVGALAPPPRDVRREMLRLQLEAEGITVNADGGIELPTEAKADAATTEASEPGTPVTDAADAAETEATENPELIRKAS